MCVAVQHNSVLFCVQILRAVATTVFFNYENSIFINYENSIFMKKTSLKFNLKKFRDKKRTLKWLITSLNAHRVHKNKN